MPWWSWIWVTTMLAVTVGGGVIDAKERRPLWYTILNVATGFLCIVFVLAHFDVIAVGSLRLLAFIALAALLNETIHELKGKEEGKSPGIVIGVAFTLLLFGPAILLGVY